MLKLSYLWSAPTDHYAQFALTGARHACIAVSVFAVWGLFAGTYAQHRSMLHFSCLAFTQALPDNAKTVPD